MNKNIFRFCLIFLLALGITSTVFPQGRQTGSIHGTVVDKEGIFLPGATITTTSKALMGQKTYVTTDTGSYRFPALPPGIYTIKCEMPGFKTIRREGVIVNMGMIVTINIEMVLSPIEEEIMVLAPSPVVDIQSTKVVTTVTTQLMQDLPLNRSLSTIISATPGTVSSVMHGGTAISNAYEVDGINVNDPSMSGRFLTVQYDAMEEVEIVTGGLPAEVGNTSGSFINVITKSGGNEFHGNLQVYYTSEKLSEILIPEYQLKAMDIGKPAAAIRDIDASGTLGGPILKDKLWFFSTLAYNKSKYHSTFVPTTILGVDYGQYPSESRDYSGMLKLTAQISKPIKLFVMAHYRDYENPYYNWGYTTVVEDSSQVSIQKQLTVTGNLSWLLGSNTMLDLRAGFSDVKWPINYHEGTENNRSYYDSYTGYYWGSTFRFGEEVWRNTRQASARITHFQDNFLGGDHEIKAGIEWQWGVDWWGWYRADPVHEYWYNGSPYYWTSVYGDWARQWWGDGYIGLDICGATADDSYAEGSENRYGAFIQDSWTIKNRLTLNIGLRFDTYIGYMPENVKKASAGIAEEIGANCIEPYYGVNPYGELKIDEWKNCMGWTSLSPRIGLVYDLFGDGKTALKAAFSQYTEALPVMYFETVHPHRPKTFYFNWWDENGNGIPDAYGIDYYQHVGWYSPLSMSEDYYKKKLDTDIKAPVFDEFTASIHHELIKNLNVSLQYIWRQKRNTVDDVLWDPDTDRYWYTYEQAPEWWVPFTTIVPAHGDFPEQEVTMYFKSKDAPVGFSRFTNVPEAKRKYQALELVFNKRMSHGWQLGGSVVYSVTKGNNSGAYGSVWGYSGAYDQPNWFVNRYGKSAYDRPLNIKVYGTFSLPLRLLASFYFTYVSGSPWSRSVTVFPPATWAEDHNTTLDSYVVLTETQGVRRYIDHSNLDFRLEKEFGLPYGKIGLFVDVYNLLGRTRTDFGQDPGGIWLPDDENTSQGAFTPSYWYGKVTGTSAVRTWKLSVRYTF